VTPSMALLSELRADDEGRYGGKSAALGELMGAGIPVPEGFGISAAAYTAFVEAAGLREQVAATLAELDVDDIVAVEAASKHIVGAIRAVGVPVELRAEVAERYEALAAEAGEPDPPVAVRSSAIGEDSAEATFAGQQETYLWMRTADGVCGAVRDCWASLHSPPAITYRARLGQTTREPAMGVAVQRMVDAEVAGVMFTCNPISGDPSVVAVNASWGLGLGVVGGDVTPDEYLVSKVTGEVVRRTVNTKQIEYRPDPAGAGTVRLDVADERAQAACLDDGQLAALVEVSRDVERHFGARQDIEWAIDGAGRLYVLQTRPVTVAPPTHGAAGVSALSLVMATFGVTKDAADGS
jgi:phosphoenolpyruvate synthase/pyruvate phosphate dikinase